ncbi:hypothetical protein MKW94_028697 [Papaver nudicaule]|uniref:Uncharacterized protein n=1 Tax=Papaver nudicaule TaxID=74823 RepID=A0AA41SD74_PAPNU|nr:hypothetical protein [Papaver nudicaule]
MRNSNSITPYLSLSFEQEGQRVIAIKSNTLSHFLFIVYNGCQSCNDRSLLSYGLLIAESSASSYDAILGVVRSSAPGTYNGLVGCDNEEDEFAMESDINRRFLFRPRRHISYGALNRNQVPCSRHGSSYYGCTRATRANPYRIGCSRITH